MKDSSPGGAPSAAGARLMRPVPGAGVGGASGGGGGAVGREEAKASGPNWRAWSSTDHEDQ